MGAKHPSKLPSFVYRQDGPELSYFPGYSIHPGRLLVKNWKILVKLGKSKDFPSAFYFLVKPLP